MTSIKTLSTTFFALLLSFAMGATAQEMPANDFSDNELQNFIDVQNDLQVIRVEYSARLEEADDPAVAAELQEAASQEMVEVLEGSDLDVDTYNQIAMALQQDEALLARVQQMLE